MIKGIDVSDNNGTVDWDLVAKAGIQFMFAKASEGITFQDRFFGRNIAGAQAVGLVTGAYHFYNPQDNPVAQSKNFLNQLQDTDFPMILAIDLEGDKWNGTDPIKRAEDLVGFLDLIQENRGLPMLYMSPAFEEEFLKNAPLSQYKRWVAEYAPACKWPYDIWQYGQGTIPGIIGPVDMNRFEGSIEALKALAVPFKG